MRGGHHDIDRKHRIEFRKRVPEERDDRLGIDPAVGRALVVHARHAPFRPEPAAGIVERKLRAGVADVGNGYAADQVRLHFTLPRDYAMQTRPAQSPCPTPV